MSINTEDLAVVHSMIRLHGAHAITKAEKLVHINASIGNSASAAKWLRVMTLIEFSELRGDRP